MVSRLMLGCYSHQKVCSESAAERSGVLLLMAAGIPRTTLDHCCWTFYGGRERVSLEMFSPRMLRKNLNWLTLADWGSRHVCADLNHLFEDIWSSLWPPQETWWTRRNPSRKRCQMPELSGSISGIKYDQNRYFAQRAPQLVAGQFVWNLSCLIFLILVFLSW